MANLVAESGGNKGQLSLLVEAICCDFHQHDEALHITEGCSDCWDFSEYYLSTKKEGNRHERLNMKD
ncbi:MAG: hypothetical protein IKX24_12040 [Prevotella sp.]|nr:hypothetical protein [Prevotella sp.]